MKNIIIKMAGAALMLTALSSCSEDNFTTFDGSKSGIYIANTSSTDINGNIQQYTDSTTFSFASYKSDVTQLTQRITVNVMGNVSDKDRAFVLKVDEAKSTSVRGTDFDFNDADCVIPAGAASVRVPVIIYRTEDLATTTKRIEFYIEDNDNFTTELESYKNTTGWNQAGKQLCGTRFKMIYNEFYTESMWYSIFGVDYYGDWSAKKEKMINAIMGWTHMDWENWAVPTGRMPFAAKQLKKQLQEAADAGTPILDEDGSYMQLPSPYDVDYSAYEH